MKERVAVIGAGTMGRGIAQTTALAGFPTTLCDVSRPALDAALASICKAVEKGIEKAKLPADARQRIDERLRLEPDLGGAARGAQWVIEAVPEAIELKQRVLAQAAEYADPSCVLASNTSSLSITGLAAALPRPERVIGLHFFNPVPVMELIEIVSGLQTAESTVAAAAEFARALGKQPIVVKDSPGFATSRLGIVLALEAIRMVEAGVASPEDIDQAMALGYRHPMGPLRLTDLVGLDVRLAIAEHLHREIGEQFRPPPLLRALVRAGHLGRKTGRGFFLYPEA
ncbi:MAG: 3-hydroxyacyl-CoA dehydrogenase family protein [Planctomycetes bacterium]|nr:3-hydroxyacyl-CoA dehydrogenase family protein [Planctomycetota bacterium]